MLRLQPNWSAVTRECVQLLYLKICSWFHYQLIKFHLFELPILLFSFDVAVCSNATERSEIEIDQRSSEWHKGWICTLTVPRDVPAQGANLEGAQILILFWGR